MEISSNPKQEYAMEKTLVIVADEHKARFFTNKDGKIFLTENEDKVNPEARAHERDLITDKPGRTFDRAGSGRHAKEQQTDPKTQEAWSFSKSIAEKIEQARIEQKIKRLVLVAEPRFLGMLRQKLTHECGKLIWKSFDKNLTKADIKIIEEEVFTLR
jgi:protein required for attachment to host cells